MKNRQAKKEAWTDSYFAVLILALITCVAYYNAWPDALALDDASFAIADRYAHLAAVDYLRFFTEDLWAASGIESGLYRPLLLASIALDSAVFSDWIPGYHLVNILLHLIMTLLVFGLSRQLLSASGAASTSIIPAAGLAALVFAVHPIHAEAVNSIFNRSEMLSGIGVTGGLWWFLNTRPSNAKMAWSGLALVYFGVLLCKESGVTLPVLTVLALWFSSPGSPREKLRQSLPVLWLILPLVLFLLLRANALGDHGLVFPPDGVGQDDQVNGGLVFDIARLPEVVVMWLESLRMLVWPYPLKIFHTLPSTPFWLAAGIQLSIIGLSVTAWARGHVGWVAGLAFFYIALLPASRIIGEPGMSPHVAERYLYLPSVGLSILLALELPWLLKRVGRRPVSIAFLVIVAGFVSLTWSRNQDWSSAVSLAERDYARDRSSGRMVETLAEALLAEGSYGRLVEVCDQRAAELPDNWFLSNSCGVAYYQTGRLDDAEQAFTRALEGENEPSARFNLAGMYLNAGRRSAAREQFEAAIEAEPNGFVREYRQADMLIQLFPTGRPQMLEARRHLEESLELQPQFFPARRKLQELNRLLGLDSERDP